MSEASKVSFSQGLMITWMGVFSLSLFVSFHRFRSAVPPVYSPPTPPPFSLSSLSLFSGSIPFASTFILGKGVETFSRPQLLTGRTPVQIQI